MLRGGLSQVSTRAFASQLSTWLKGLRLTRWRCLSYGSRAFHPDPGDVRRERFGLPVSGEGASQDLDASLQGDVRGRVAPDVSFVLGLDLPCVRIGRPRPKGKPAKPRSATTEAKSANLEVRNLTGAVARSGGTKQRCVALATDGAPPGEQLACSISRVPKPIRGTSCAHLLRARPRPPRHGGPLPARPAVRQLRHCWLQRFRISTSGGSRFRSPTQRTAAFNTCSAVGFGITPSAPAMPSGSVPAFAVMNRTGIPISFR